MRIFSVPQGVLLIKLYSFPPLYLPQKNFLITISFIPLTEAGSFPVVLFITDYNSVPSSSLKLSHSFKLLQDFSSCTNFQKSTSPSSLTKAASSRLEVLLYLQVTPLYHCLLLLPCQLTSRRTIRNC